MKYTLLELVQNVLSSIDGDEVNSISDTVESAQVVKIIRSVYFDIIHRANLPEHYSIVTLDASTDNTKPVLMTVPSNVEKVIKIKYDKRLEASDPALMEDVTFQTLENFMERMYMLDTTEDNVSSFTHQVGPDIFTFYYITDQAPTYYTTFDDHTIIFDAYNSSIENTLQKSNTVCIGQLIIPFTESDTFTPDLDDEQFPLLLNEAKSLAWIELKQSQHPIAERNSRRAWVHSQKNKEAVQGLSDFDKLVNFGRK